MYEIKEVKPIVNETELTYCSACLSSGRKLTRVEQLGGYTEILASICDNAMRPLLLLCWECMAVLRKVKRFKARIYEAQTQLSNHFTQKQTTTTVESLSKLSIKTADNVIFITHTDEEIIDDKETITIIKQEIKHSDDESNFDPGDEVNDVCLKEIKKEVKPQIKRSKAKHYKIVYGENVFKKRMLRKKFAIKSEEVALWYEKEKNSDFYKSFRFKCKMCFHGYNIKEKLQKHYMERHNPSLGPHECGTCRARFGSVPSLSAHAHAHRSALWCARCEFACYSTRRLYAHMDAHRMYQCVYCGMCLANLCSFLAHFKSLHSAFECDHCGKRCKSKHLIEKHIKRHVTAYKCPQCPRQYRSRGGLHKHRAARHRGDAPELAYCAPCGKQFCSALEYRRHVRTTAAHALETHNSVKKQVSCPECENTYSRRAYMMNHFRHVHMNQSRHYCAPCDRHFLNRTRFVEHTRFHHEGAARQKNKLCNICGRGFATNRILVNHLRTHSGERPFECTDCGANFTQKHSMLSHVKYVHLKSKRRAAWHQ